MPARINPTFLFLQTTILWKKGKTQDQCSDPGYLRYWQTRLLPRDQTRLCGPMYEPRNSVGGGSQASEAQDHPIIASLAKII